ncbi:hypothetical protein Q4574_01520 [Aliiglaciecola sp. 3_MG-2023]|uniref:hypothetical protein n=1 Tax=Aliiglaciecola sp. 3_MG-2023 TaxID=3062644 RepID=UPI0026E354BF|nr:hypothetical protein [Aliiglaciecola sp. 3_MG-2023]MDO6691938.1 hypothetical protein [Aliiglaciecola sp. 3_MG-2023]
MSPIKPLSIWVVDPGLMEAGGHHAALAESFCQFQNQGLIADENNVSVTAYSHQLLDHNLKVKLENAGITVNLFFETLFYKHFHDGAVLGPAGIQRYVRKLCSEYEIALLNACDQINISGENHLLFFPCLNWEHAWALNLAISLHRAQVENPKLKLVCCAMYSPISGSSSSCKKMWYRLGFQGLMSVKNLNLYCSEYELSQTYQELLDCSIIRTHPCYLMDWSAIQPNLTQSSTLVLPENTVLLYLGDAKEDKGFNRLPELLTRSLANTPENTHFLIQYTLAWEYPELNDTLKKLRNWTKKEPRLILHHGFLSNLEMAHVMRRIKMAVCTYDTQVYQNKSSGLLWMLAYFNVPLIIGGSCWLTREAQRLGVSYEISAGLTIQDSIVEQTMQDSDILSYKKLMFEPLMNWLVNH